MKIWRWSIILALLLTAQGWIVEHRTEMQSHVDSVAGWNGELLQAVQVFLSGPAAFFLFARLEAPRLLQHPMRARLRASIESEPGLGLTELARRNGIGWGTAVYHLDRMEGAGFVRSETVGRTRAFFLPNHSAAVKQALLERGDGPRQRLLSALRETDGSSQGCLAARAGLSLPLANRYLKRLESEGWITSCKTWRTRTYSFRDATAERPTSFPHLPVRSESPAVSLRGTSAQ